MRRPDYLKEGVDRVNEKLDPFGIWRRSVSAPRRWFPPELLEPPSPAVRALPDMQLLVLDLLGTLHLIGLEGDIARLGKELMQWPVRDVMLTVKPGKGKFRAVEIVSDETELLLAAPWKNDHQREALELIERETA